MEPINNDKTFLSQVKRTFIRWDDEEVYTDFETNTLQDEYDEKFLDMWDP